MAINFYGGTYSYKGVDHALTLDESIQDKIIIIPPEAKGRGKFRNFV